MLSDEQVGALENQVWSVLIALAHHTADQGIDMRGPFGELVGEMSKRGDEIARLADQNAILRGYCLPVLEAVARLDLKDTRIDWMRIHDAQRALARLEEILNADDGEE